MRGGESREREEQVKMKTGREAGEQRGRGKRGSTGTNFII
jgi:hypothetical protein